MYYNNNGCLSIVEWNAFIQCLWEKKYSSWFQSKLIESNFLRRWSASHSSDQSEIQDNGANFKKVEPMW